MVMGLLRAASDAVIVGAGTVHQSPDHVWTPGFVSPHYEDSFNELRSRLGMHTPPVCVVVTATGVLDLARPLFTGRRAPVVIVTTARGAGNLSKSVIPPGVRMIEAGTREHLQVPEILDAIRRVVNGGTLFLVEGGPHLIGEFFDAGKLDELFLTLSPRLAGRDSRSERAGLISGTVFLPDRLVAGTLRSVRKGGSHLFLRYSFTTH
jgi:riboflavin biosynthesis pyrimidine reductase